MNDIIEKWREEANWIALQIRAGEYCDQTSRVVMQVRCNVLRYCAATLSRHLAQRNTKSGMKVGTKVRHKEHGRKVWEIELIKAPGVYWIGRKNEFIDMVPEHQLVKVK